MWGTPPRSWYVPEFNSVIAFRVPRWHEVTPVIVDRPRFSVFGWFLEEGELYPLLTNEPANENKGQELERKGTDETFLSTCNDRSSKEQGCTGVLGAKMEYKARAKKKTRKKKKIRKTRTEQDVENGASTGAIVPKVSAKKNKKRKSSNSPHERDHQKKKAPSSNRKLSLIKKLVLGTTKHISREVTTKINIVK